MQNSSLTIPAPKNFKLMVIGQIISIFGASLLRFALSLYILDITGRADIYATIYAISNIPLLLAPIGGAIADRFNRRNLMVIFDFSSSMIIFIFIFIMLSGTVSIPIIAVVMVLLAIISAMYQPAVQASIPLLVRDEKLDQSNGIVNGVNALSNVAAPVIGGILYGILGVKSLIILSCIAFFLSAVMEIFIKIPFEKRELEQHIIPTIIKDMREGFVYVVKQSYIFKSMIVAALINLILTPFILVGAPIILRVTMQSTDTLYGVGMGIIQFSSILGALSMGFFAKRMQMKTLYRQALILALLFLPIALTVSPVLLNLGYYPSYILFLICMIPVMIVLIIISIFVITRVQRQTPNELLGKVMAIIMAVAQCAAPIGQVIYGVLFEKFSLKIYIPSLIVFAVMLILTPVIGVFYRNEKD